ncbi:hypothetical protein [Aliikangiella sp. G2MR2-5]|uniref:hypothetical protein n=1 Tax=Aliikangiella sp. G2MR2-5 TaxID=2788943 RepID=UPI0018AC5495|nr:hypothetical protein [Aliikangiella sp. G2MR2-5]
MNLIGEGSKTENSGRNFWITACCLAFGISLLTSCGGSSEENLPIAEAAECELFDEDEDGSADCGTVLIGLTDADGDFLTYQVEVTGLSLIRRDGAEVSVMPSTQSIDFADYVDLSELAAAATIPTGVYESGSIRLNYANADIQVEKSGEAVVASMVDESGQAITEATLTLSLDADNPLVISRTRAALLELDFNLAASHSVDLEVEPVTVTTEPFIVAEVDPVLSKEFRLRGPLVRVNEEESAFKIAVRPFHRKEGRFGGAPIFVDENTQFDINGESYSGDTGLTVLAELPAGTATVTQGLFEHSSRHFTAATVVAGSSVPGFDRDAVKGVIVARKDNQLTVRGASLIRESGEVTFRDELSVSIGEETTVKKWRRSDEVLTIDDLSVGQAVTVLGTYIEASEEAENASLDATDGAVKMRLTYASGHAVAIDAVQIDLNLQSLQARSPEQYDFSGTGVDASFDADPQNYEISIADLMVTNAESGDSVRVSGFVSPFGTAPADFDAMSVTNYAESGSQIYINWPDSDELVAFAEITASTLIINTPEEGVYKLQQGGIRTDLTSFDTLVTLTPKSERGIYTIRSGEMVLAFSDFLDFSNELQQRLNEGESIDAMHAIGGFSSDSKVMDVIKLSVKLH